MTSVLEALKSAQFVVDAKGQRVAVQLNLMLWEALLAWLENVDVILMAITSQTQAIVYPLDSAKFFSY
ncbi:MAG: hypothetical protein AAFW84_31100 [Cyanobacteria bacterium J06635_15]